MASGSTKVTAGMDLKKMIGELEAERDRLDHAILALERLSRAPQSKRGRPPKWLSDITSGDSHASKAQVNGKK